MAFTLKYLKYVDPYNGEQTKNYGWEITIPSASIKARATEDGVAVLKNEPYTRVVRALPRYDSVEEVSQEEFEALDVSAESPMSTKDREKRYVKAQKLEALYSVDVAVANDEQLAAKLEPVLGKV